jgi:hypothetical protein
MEKLKELREKLSPVPFHPLRIHDLICFNSAVYETFTQGKINRNQSNGDY